MSATSLGDVAGTALLTASMRAADARAARPILADPFVERALERSGAVVPRALAAGPNAAVIVSRARRFDVWTRAFLEENPEGQVLHLGCGLDARPLRVPRPATSRWVDVDQPDMIELRRRVYDLPDDVVTIPASVTDPSWWADVDADRPTLVVAEGLLMYLPGEEVHALVGRALDRLASGALVFDAVAGWTVGLTRVSVLLGRIGVRFAWADEDLARRHPALRGVDDVPVLDVLAGSPEVGVSGVGYAALARLPALRDAMRLHRYAFGTRVAVRPDGAPEPGRRR